MMNKIENKCRVNGFRVTKPVAQMKSKSDIHIVDRHKPWWILTENVLAGMAWNG